MNPDLSDPNRTTVRNLATLFAVSALIGVGASIYEVALPLYFNRLGMSWANMGWIYGAAAAITFVIRVGLGMWSDRAGRKVVYVLTLFSSGLATLATPMIHAMVPQALLRSVADPSIKAREEMHSVLLYEDSPKRFRRVFGQTRGVEYVFHVVGLLASAWFLARMAGFGEDVALFWIFVAASVTLLASGAVFMLLYRERPRREFDKSRVSWSDLLRPRLSRPMWILTASNFVFFFGIQVSHCFALQLFFVEKYGASTGDIFILGALHRVGSALPLLFLSHVFHRNLKRWLMFFLVTEGFFVALPGFLPGGETFVVFGLELSAYWTAVTLWLFHDVLGRGLWLPMQQELIQRHSNPASRGKDVSLSQSIATIGAVMAPFVAGWLRDWPGIDRSITVNFPFIFSGIGMVVSALMLIPLPKGE